MISQDNIGKIYIRKKSLDARKKPELFFVYSLEFELTDKNIAQKLMKKKKITKAVLEERRVVVRGVEEIAEPPIVVGSGPAGIFSAWLLAEYGYRPVIIERGKKVSERVKDVDFFWETGNLNTSSNVQFGEGGAGTFSDGKLTSRSKDPLVREVLEILVKAGAPEEILYESKPHLGTDRLRNIISNMRKQIEDKGGTFLFENTLEDLCLESNRVSCAVVSGKNYPVSALVLAIGHSARDTYEMLYNRQVFLERKPFAMGLRIEHPQSLIDQNQLGGLSENLGIGAAEYTLSYQDKENLRGVYSFCMCPGGQVVAAASEKGHLVVNGMSYSKRDSGLANSAIVVSVKREDFEGDSPLAGIEYQRQWEKKAYLLGGGNFAAPCQRVVDFLARRKSTELDLENKTSYKPGIVSADLWECLPPEVSSSIEKGIMHFNKLIPGFTGEEAVFTGVETRTSSPVRITRNEDLVSVSAGNLYPVGEGAGYAGGIVSAAVDGLKAAEKIMEKYILR